MRSERPGALVSGFSSGARRIGSRSMTIPPTEIDVREEIDIVSLDPLFIERQRNRYGSRAVAYVVWLNGLAAIALLLGLAHATISPDNVKRFADAMLVFGAGAAAGL